MENSTQTEAEIRILATALFSDNTNIREKVFNFGFFASDIAKRLNAVFLDVYKKYPNGDYSIYVSALKSEDSKSLVYILQSAVTSKISENQLDDVLFNLKNDFLKQEFKQNILNLTLSDYGVNDVKQVIEKAEQETDFNLNSLDLYFSDYNKPIEQIPTGFSGLDNILNGGLIRGTIAAVGARPSVGKTAFAVNITAHTSEFKTLFFSLEMSARMVYDKLLSIVGNLDYSEVGKHNVGVDTAKMFLQSFDKLTVIDNISEVEKMVEIIGQVKPDLVIVDYMQIIQSTKNFVDNRQRVDYISQTLKQTAKRVNCCIINLSQLTRAGKDEPTMSDLKESGGLEQDSDYILILHRPYVTDKKNKDLMPNDTKLKIEKNKFGNTGVFDYDFQGKYQKFEEKHDSVAHIKKEESELLDEDLPF